MPYPDLRDPILKEKLHYADIQTPHSNAGDKLYDSICMKAVNQSIGRSIRHINDFASIILLDSRYSKPKIFNQLPSWIGNLLNIPKDFQEAKVHLSQFYEQKNY